jgi:hypothetical protein
MFSKMFFGTLFIICVMLLPILIIEYMRRFHPPEPEKVMEITATPTPMRVSCFDRKLKIEASSSQVETGEMIRFATEGVTGGENYGDVGYVWETSAGTIAGNQLDANLDSSGIGDKSILVTVTARAGNCLARGVARVTTTQPVIAYTPPPTPTPEIKYVQVAQPTPTPTPTPKPVFFPCPPNVTIAHPNINCIPHKPIIRCTFSQTGALVSGPPECLNPGLSRIIQ